MNVKTLLKSLNVAIVVALLITACGGSDSASDETTMTSATETTTGSDDGGLGSLADDLGGTITTILKENDLFSTLLAVLTDVELDELLDGEGPYTLLAPVNKAFNDLPEGVFEKLQLPENRETLITILKYHILDGDYRLENLSNGNIETLQGSPVAIEVLVNFNFNEKLKVNGKFVIIPNLRLTNGTIHVMNWLMLPPGIDLSAL